MIQYKNKEGITFNYKESYYRKSLGKMKPYIVIANKTTVKVLRLETLGKDYKLVKN